MNRFVNVMLFFNLAVASLAGPLYALDYTWNSANGDFTTAANWSPATVPSGQANVAYIENNGTAWLDSTSATPTYNADLSKLYVGDVAAIATGGNGNGTLTIGTGGSLTPTTGARNLYVGSDTGKSGTVNVNGGTLTVGNAIYLGNLTTSGTATGYGYYKQTGGAATFGTTVVVGYGNGVGKVELSDGTLTTNGHFSLGDTATANTRGYSKQSGGEIRITNAAAPHYYVGRNSMGFAEQTAGTVTIPYGNFLVANAGGNAYNYGYYKFAGGTINLTTSTIANGIFVGSGRNGIFEQSNGDLNVNTFGAIGGVRTVNALNAYGVFTLSGGTVDTNLVDSTYPFLVGSNGAAGMLNIRGGQFTVNGTNRMAVGYADTASLAGGKGIVNLGAVAECTGSGGGGTLAVNWLETSLIGTSASTGLLNFHGGTLQARSNQTDFLKNTVNYVYAEGAIIDTAGKDIAIQTALLAPTGDGIPQINVAAAGGGSGYDAPPVVKISGTGTGATAYAEVTGGAVTKIVVTNPGTGYTGTPTVSLEGGGGTLALAEVVQLLANRSGGLTKKGLGTLLLMGGNTYTGLTSINEGILALTGVIAGDANISSGATLKGTGSILGGLDAASGSLVEPGLSPGMLTINGAANLSAGATMKWELAALTDDAGSTPGTDFDKLLVGGNLILGGASQLALNFDLLPEADRPSAASPNSFWSSNHQWKIIDAGTNAGGTNFTALVSGTVPAGWHFETAVGTVPSDAGDIYLVYVPEPSTWTLLVLALLGAALSRQRWRKSRSSLGME
jgi:autotransporter-associated beta strand protein